MILASPWGIAVLARECSKVRSGSQFVQMRRHIWMISPVPDVLGTVEVGEPLAMLVKVGS